MRSLSIILVFLSIALSCIAYPHLPERVPTHWSAGGEINGWSSRGTATVMMPAVMLAILLLFRALPRLSPMGYEIDASSRAFLALELSILALLLAIHVVTFLAAMRYDVPVETLVPVGVGVLFVVLGNYMTKFPRNFFIGIRTPWTLANEEVWLRTHRFGAKIFVGAGVLLAASALLPNAARGGAVVAVVAVTAFAPIVYSWAVYRRLLHSRG